MKKTTFISNEQKSENRDGPNEISEEERTTAYPPLFCGHTTTKSVPICHRIHQNWPAMSIGRNYRLNFEKRLRKMNESREKKLNIKILDRHSHMIKKSISTKKKNTTSKYNSDERTDNTPGVVPLMDLLSGKWYREQAEKRKQRKLMMKLEKEKSMRKPQPPLNWFPSAPTALSPEDQLTILRDKWIKEINNRVTSEKDNEIIQYYLNEGIPKDMYDPFPEQMLENIKKHRIKPMLLANHGFVLMMLENEIRQNYDYANRKIILDYILMDPDERKRIGITNYYRSDNLSMVVRGPVPWRKTTIIQKEQLKNNLYNFNKYILKLNKVWEKYSEDFIFPIENLGKPGVPIAPKFLQEFLEKSCENFRHRLVKEWVVECANLYVDIRKRHSDILSKPGIKASKDQIQKFFDCVAATMSRQLREIVFKSLNHFMSKIIEYKDGNVMDAKYNDSMFIIEPLFVLKAVPNPNSVQISFEPTREDCLNLLLSIPRKIIKAVEDIPRVEQLLVKKYKGDSTMVLSNVHESEEEVQNMFVEIGKILENNFPGPETYIKCFEKYSYLLNGTETEALNTFFGTDPFPSLSDFNEWVIKYVTIEDDIIEIWNRVYLNLITLDVSEVTQHLKNIIKSLKNKIIDYYMKLTKENVYGINNACTIMAAKSSEIPDTAEGLVELSNYITECQVFTLPKIKAQLATVLDYIMFLFDYTHFEESDIHLSSRVYRWPEEIEELFDLATSRVIQKKRVVEGQLKTKKTEFESDLKSHLKLLENLKKKDPPTLTNDDIITATEEVERLVNCLKEDTAVAKSINHTEKLLDVEVTSYTQLHSMVAASEPFDHLWHTVRDFNNYYEVWFNGPFRGLNAVEIKEIVDNVWKTFQKLARTLQDYPGSKRVAEIFRDKVGDFKKYLPVLETICNPDIQDRHWLEISKHVGVDLHPNESSTLSEMIEIGLLNHIEKLEEINV